MCEAVMAVQNDTGSCSERVSVCEAVMAVQSDTEPCSERVSVRKSEGTLTGLGRRLSSPGLSVIGVDAALA